MTTASESRTDDPQLQLLNANIAKLAAAKPAGDAFGAFALAAHLADLAVESALELGQMPGVDMKAFQPTIKFWKVVRDQCRAAAFACVGKITRLRARWLPSGSSETSKERRQTPMRSENAGYIETAELAEMLADCSPKTARQMPSHRYDGRSRELLLLGWQFP